jgi:hypothetical protein
MQPFPGAELLILLLAVVYVIALSTIKWYRNRPRARGFEVKLTTGEPPVPREKK